MDREEKASAAGGSGAKMKMYVVSRVFDLLDACARYGLFPLFFWLCVRELAGQETIVDVAVNYLSKGGNLIPWGLATGGLLYGYGERKLRQRKIASMSHHVSELERRLDPGRTSSGLTSTGQTPRRRIKGQERGVGE